MPLPHSPYPRSSSNYSYHGSPAGRYFSNMPNTQSFDLEDGISVDDLPEQGYPSGCTACAAAAWVDTLRFIQYMCI
eukprot:scaffold5480_cov133-Skeletonema_menzelii.AAC.4